jgi:predicted nucleic acid-binding protein
VSNRSLLRHTNAALRSKNATVFALYDSMIVASALIAGGKALYAQDLHHGQVIDDQLRVVNPFLGGQKS